MNTHRRPLPGQPLKTSPSANRRSFGLRRATAVLAIITMGCSVQRSSPTGSPATLPSPWCSPGVSIGPANGPLTPEQESAAKARVAADPVIAQIKGTWHILAVGPSSASCAGQPERLVGATVRVGFDQPENASWDEDLIACVHGRAQPTRLEDEWSGIDGAVALVPLPTGTIQWLSSPPGPVGAHAKLTQTTKSTLGPRGGSCPKRESSD